MKNLIYLLSILMTIPSWGRSNPNNTYICKRLEQTPVMDGNIRDDPAWMRIKPMSNFLRLQGKKPSSKQSSFKMGCNEKGIFLGIECIEPEIQKLKASLGDNDRLWEEDSIEIFLKPSKSTSYYHFVVNTIGSRFVETLFKSESSRPLTLKDWQAVVYKGKDFWSVEIFIPFSKIYPLIPRKEEVWTGNICRNTFTSKDKCSSWAIIANGGFHQPDKFNKIIFKGGFSSPEERRKLEKNLIKEYLKDEILKAKAAINKIKLENPSLYKTKVSKIMERWNETEKKITQDSIPDKKIHELFKQTLFFLKVPSKLNKYKKEHLINEFFDETSTNN